MRYECHRPTWVIVAMFATALSGAVLADSAPKPVCPGATWATLKPAEAGIDAARLDAAIANSSANIGCVVRYGYLVKTWGNQMKRGGGGSEIKPLFSHLLFEAVNAGKLSSVDELVGDYEPRLNGLNKALGYKDRKMRFRHMANQNSCYSYAEDPGTAFDYNDYQMALLNDTLFFKVWGASSFGEFNKNVMQPRLVNPLQMEDNPQWDDNGRFPMTVRDHCRFVLLYLRRGNWNGRQLLSANDALMAVCGAQPGAFPDTTEVDAEMLDNARSMGNFTGFKNPHDNHRGSYSFAWWTNGVDRDGKRRLPDCPTDMFGCEGGGGAAGVYALPGLDLIVGFRAPNTRRLTDQRMNEFFRGILDAVVAGRPANKLPTVSAGTDQTISLPATVALAGSVSQDGPSRPKRTLWHFINGRAPVSIEQPNALATTARLSAAGRYVLRLTADTGASLVSDDVTIDVDPADLPIATIEAPKSRASEEGCVPGTFRIRRFGPTSLPLTVRFSTLGTATVGQDCNDFGSSVTIPVGSRSTTITVTPKDDAIVEGTEVVFLKLVPGPGYVVGTPSGAGVSIEDNDTELPIVTVVAHDATAGVPDNPGRFMITASRNLYGKTVRLQLTGTATNGKEYQTIPPSVTFSNIINSNVAQIIVTPVGKSIHKGTKTVTLTLMPSPDSEYFVGTQQSATVTIRGKD